MRAPTKKNPLLRILLFFYIQLLGAVGLQNPTVPGGDVARIGFYIYYLYIGSEELSHLVDSFLVECPSTDTAIFVV
jgi:uncharacterized protein YqgC (DUF456 family)